MQLRLHTPAQHRPDDQKWSLLPTWKWVYDTWYTKKQSKIESGDTRSKLSLLGYVEIPSTHQKDTEQNGAKQLHPNRINFRFHVTLGEWSVSWVFFLNFVPPKFSPLEPLKKSQAGYRKWQERQFVSDLSGSMLKFRWGKGSEGISASTGQCLSSILLVVAGKYSTSTNITSVMQ